MTILNKPNVNKALERVVRGLSSIERLSQQMEPIYMTNAEGRDRLATEEDRLFAIENCVESTTADMAFLAEAFEEMGKNLPDETYLQRLKAPYEKVTWDESGAPEGLCLGALMGFTCPVLAYQMSDDEFTCLDCWNTPIEEIREIIENQEE